MYKVGIITASDKGSKGLREDLSGPAIKEIIQGAEGFEPGSMAMVPDDIKQLKETMIAMADDEGMDLILTTGGTGFSPSDVTPEATREVIERPVPGIPEAMRHLSQKITPRAMLSRAEAGIRGKCLIINLPGSPKAIRETLEYLLPSVLHGLDILQENDGECAAQT